MRWIPVLVAWVLPALLSACAFAGSFSVTPIRVELSNGQRSVALTVRNDGDQPSVVQTQIVAWSQDNNEDKLEPTQEVIASPPIFTVQAGGSQVLRVALRRMPDPAVERSYRIQLTEVPGKAQPGFTGAQFALKISLPIFVEASAAKTQPLLQWRAKQLPSGEMALTATNSGARHIQIHTLEILNEQSAVDASHASMFYVLPSQTRTVNVKPAAGRVLDAARIRIKAESDAGPLSADVAVDR